MNPVFMQRALELAQQAFEADEVPIGAVVVNPETQEIVAEAHNLSEHSGDMTAHAELLALRKACQTLKQNRLRGLDLYVSLEPCTMCAAAISFARIENLFFGAEDVKGGAVVNGVQFYQAPTCHHKPHVEGGIMAEESAALLKKFFSQKRKKIPHAGEKNAC